MSEKHAKSEEKLTPTKSHFKDLSVRKSSSTSQSYSRVKSSSSVIPKNVSSIRFSDSEPSNIKRRRGAEKEKKRIKKAKKRQEASQPVYHSPYDIIGVKKMILSTITQKIMGCVVGDDVSAENPWKYIRKELIDDNIDLHEESSEFLNLQNEIKMYPDSEILIGWIPGASDKYDYFNIVFTLEAKEIILKVIEQERAEMKQKLHMAIARPVGTWKSYGSENEVVDGMIRNLRPLYEVQLNARYPLTDKPVSWKFRKVEDTRDGYVELLPDDRHPVEVVQKRRVDATVQAAPSSVTKKCQTNQAFPVNAATQYEYIITKRNEDEHEGKEKKFGGVAKKTAARPVFKTEYMSSSIEKISEELNERNYIHVDDYASLLQDKRLRMDTSGNLSTFASFSDSLFHREKYLSSASWDPFTTGIVAASYSDMTTNAIISQDKSEECFESSSFALIWSYSDHTFPKLYLEAPRQITALKFSPYEKNVLIGGLINGQVVIWDLKNKLEDIERLEIFSREQQNHRAILKQFLTWMKNTYSKNIIQPTIVTGLKNSQREMITDISWLMPGACIDGNGNLAYGHNPNEFHKQFLTSSLDGTVAVWDMEVQQETLEHPKKIKMDILQRRLSALETEESKYLALGKQFKPFLKWEVQKEKQAWPITALVKLPEIDQYDPIGDIDPNPMIRSHYQLANKQNPFPEVQSLIVSTTGQVAETRCDTFHYRTGHSVQSKYAVLKHFTSLHDGPVTVCHVNPFFNNIILTVGGVICSLWNTEINEAILWNKAQAGYSYLSGGWSKAHPSYFILIRSDGSFEVWDLLTSRIKPLRVIPLSLGMNLYGTTTPLHSRKGTFAISDSIGNLLIMYTPDILSIHGEDEISSTKIVFERALRRRKIINEWMVNFGEKYVSSVDDRERRDAEATEFYIQLPLGKRSEVRAKVSEIEKMDKIFGVEWHSLGEQNMFKKMLSLKGLNLNELEKQKYPLQEQIRERKEFQRKQEHIMADKERIFKNAKALLYPKRQLEKIRTYSFIETANDKDYAFIEDYDEIERRALNFIEANKFDIKDNPFHQQIDNAKIRLSITRKEPERRQDRLSIFRPSDDNLI